MILCTPPPSPGSLQAQPVIIHTDHHEDEETNAPCTADFVDHMFGSQREKVSLMVGNDFYEKDAQLQVDQYLQVPHRVWAMVQRLRVAQQRRRKRLNSLVVEQRKRDRRSPV